jgi:nucleotide-binding universal stress UspA family protein
MDLAPPVILMSEANSRSGDIQTLLNHVENVDADLILINTHAREGVERFFMGSFAETLGLRSTVPVLFVSPNCAPIKSLDKIVYPTNFSSSSFTIYKHFLQQYAGIVKEVVIHNKIMRPINAFAESSLTAMGGSWIAPQEYIDKENKRREEIGQEWSQSATELSVKASVNVDSDLGDVSESIEKATRETGADMVVVGSFASALETAIIGSIARQVVRQGHVPTLVVHKPS